MALQMYSRIGYESIIPSGDMLAFLEIQKEVRMLRRSLDQLTVAVDIVMPSKLKFIRILYEIVARARWFQYACSVLPTLLFSLLDSHIRWIGSLLSVFLSETNAIFFSNNVLHYITIASTTSILGVGESCESTLYPAIILDRKMK